VIGQERVEALPLEHERDRVDGRGVRGAHDPGDRDVAEQRDLLLEVPADRPIRTAHDRIRLQAERAELLHRVLRGLGLELARGPDERHQGDVHEGAVVATDLVAELPDRL
jgi:hypothetical protein